MPFIGQRWPASWTIQSIFVFLAVDICLQQGIPKIIRSKNVLYLHYDIQHSPYTPRFLTLVRKNILNRSFSHKAIRYALIKDGELWHSFCLVNFKVMYFFRELVVSFSKRAHSREEEAASSGLQQGPAVRHSHHLKRQCPSREGW